MDETFTLSNAAPQVGDGFNRDMWSRLERFVQETATTCANVWVVTGPLFLPLRRPDGAGYVMQHATIGARWAGALHKGGVPVNLLTDTGHMQRASFR